MSVGVFDLVKDDDSVQDNTSTPDTLDIYARAMNEVRIALGSIAEEVVDGSQVFLLGHSMIGKSVFLGGVLRTPSSVYFLQDGRSCRYHAPLCHQWMHSLFDAWKQCYGRENLRRLVCLFAATMHSVLRQDWTEKLKAAPLLGHRSLP